MNRENTPRVQYHAGQYLRHDDLADDQAYHLTRHRRHLIAHHTWGIVQGLSLLVEQNTVLVEPGLAVDGYGRELVLGRRRPLPATAFDDHSSDTLDMWLTYDLQEAATAPDGYTEPRSDKPSAVRWSEEPRVEWRAADTAPADPWNLPEVNEADQEFGPERQPPDDPRLRWPIYLGRIRRRLSEQTMFQVDTLGRPYAGLVGHTLEPPWRDGTRLTFGAPKGSPQQDGADPHFAIQIPDEKGNPTSQLEIQRDGAVAIHGNTTINGDLTIDGGLEFHLDAAPAHDPPTPRPWQVYLAEDQGVEELRIELDGSEEVHRVSIGSFSPESQAFEPALTVAGNHTVTVHGDLVVEGLVIRGPHEPGPAMSPEARSFLMGSYLGGQSAAGSAEQFSERSTAIDLLSDIARAATQPELLDKLAQQMEKEAPQFLETLKDVLLRTTGSEHGPPWS